MDDLKLEIKQVLYWLEKNCRGVSNAKTRKNILPYVSHLLNCSGGQEAQDRHLRRILSALKHLGWIGSTPSEGYWYIILDNIDDINAALASVNDMEAKAKDMLQGTGKLRAKFEDAKQVVGKGQMTLGKI